MRCREDLPDPDAEDSFADVEMSMFLGTLRLLARAMCAQSPALEHALGPHLPSWLLPARMHVATGDSWAQTWQLWQSHLLPDNPATILPDDNVQGLRHAKREHFLQLADYFNSLRSARPRGRPKNNSAQPSGQRDIDPARAADAALAYNNSQDGIHWTTTAGQLFPELNLYDPREKEKARKRVDRRIYLGARLAREKKLDA